MNCIEYRHGSVAQARYSKSVKMKLHANSMPFSPIILRLHTCLTARIIFFPFLVSYANSTMATWTSCQCFLVTNASTMMTSCCMYSLFFTLLKMHKNQNLKTSNTANFSKQIELWQKGICKKSPNHTKILQKDF